MKKTGAIILSSMLVFTMTACGGKSESTESNENKTYVEEAQFDEVFASPSDFEGQYIKISGELWQFEQDGDTLILDVVDHSGEEDRYMVVYAPRGSAVLSASEVTVDGKIEGETETRIDEYAGSPAVKINDATVEELDKLT